MVGIAVAFALAGLPSSARADIALSFYLGASQTRPSDLHVTQSARGNDATMHDVRWPGYPFRFEPYYGIRLGYNPPGQPQTGIVLDFTHYKIYGRTEEAAEQTGIWHHRPIDTFAPIRERVQSFEITHGLNMLGLSVLQQLSGAGNGAYIGGGPVMYVPHSENRVDGLPGGDRYDFGGFGFQVQAGARGCLGDHRLFGEMKYNQGNPTVTIAQGKAETTV
ncbi:MAG TPA: hypothetical protein VE591_05325, partial [Candidatus Acidoferrum sp.]|nr:hypothetical protein [Candidatus Acidoferrum sp.]